MARKRSSQFNTRQYMLSQDYEIFYYSDLHFQSVGSHSHDYYEFYFFDEGAVTMEIDGKPYSLKRGDVIVVPPGVSHRAILSDPEVPYRRFVFWISRTYFDSLTAQSRDYGYLRDLAERDGRCVHHLDLLTFNAVRADLFTLLDEIHAARFGREVQINLCVCRLLIRLNRFVYDAADGKGKRKDLSWLEAITGFIDTHLEEDLSLERIAGEFYLSKFYLAHLFRDQAGVTVHQYLTKRRLAACLAAMRKGTSASEAASSFGFPDYSAFYRAFQREYGLPPSRFREIE